MNKFLKYLKHKIIMLLLAIIGSVIIAGAGYYIVGDGIVDVLQDTLTSLGNK